MIENSPKNGSQEEQGPEVNVLAGGISSRIPGLKKGDPLVWAGAAASTLTLGLFIALVVVVLTHGLGIFWVDPVHRLVFNDGKVVLGNITDHDSKQNKDQVFTANRDVYGLDYRWVELNELKERDLPAEAVMFERREKGNFLGFLKSLRLGDETVNGTHEELWARFESELDLMHDKVDESRDLLGTMADINATMEKTRLKMLGMNDQSKITALKAQQEQRRKQFQSLNEKLDARRAELARWVAVMSDAGGNDRNIRLMDIIRAFRPNQMGAFDKVGFYLVKIHELLTDAPRESNTEGGLFPAILGTVLMVMIMSVFCVPLGVVAAVYLREYAKEGMLVNLVRIAVNNLAGVPSIVYGMFGLGFFVYGIGGTIDSVFFDERLPLATFGTGGLLWSSLTMALLTVPVVIVSTEEGLNSVPQGVRDGSLALGATKFQTLQRVILPMATPGILTGLILAIARAAGEVAPLMLVGVVKIVPSLPVEGNFPFLFLERKFMHLGFHIFDVGFQSPNVEAAKPMVYVTTLLLLFLVLTMSFLAMYLRNRMKKRYSTGAF